MFEMLFKLPLTMEGIVYQSQVQQAIAIKAGVEYWHAHQPRCMGAIYWQLNDNWPTVSWASIEHGGKWKQLNYHAKRFFAPVSGVMFKDIDGDIKHYVINDFPYAVKLKATLNCRSIISGEVLSSESCELELDATSSKLVKNYGSKFDNDFNAEEVYYELVTENLNDKTIHKNEFFTVLYKELKLQKTEVTAEVKEENGKFLVELSTEAPALYVTCDAVGIKGTFSDNSILLAPQEKVVLEFEPKEKCDAQKLAASLTIDHLQKYY
jgi:beta-mannosidase